MSLVPYVHLPAGCLAGAAAGEAMTLPDDARHRLHRVLRLQAGAPVVVADRQGRESAAVLGVGTVVLEGLLVEHDPPVPALHLVQGLAKGRKVDEVVRSATELGVDRITVVQARRSDLKVAGDKADKLLSRWQGIAVSAAEQARRPFVPDVSGPVDLARFVGGLDDGVRGVVGHPDADSALGEVLAEDLGASSEPVLAVVGPEGGWTDEEVDLLAAAGLPAATLGRSVLRTEHAGTAMCAVLAYHLGRMG